MRTNIDIDDDLLQKAMQAGPYTTKKDTVEAGLRMLARQAAYREILKWRGKLKWEGDESIDWTKPDPDAETGDALVPEPSTYQVQESRPVYNASRAAGGSAAAPAQRAGAASKKKAADTRRARR